MLSDPIVSEIHHVREKIWGECQGSVEKMAERQKQIQKQNTKRLIQEEEWEARRIKLKKEVQAKE